MALFGNKKTATNGTTKKPEARKKTATKGKAAAPQSMKELYNETAPAAAPVAKAGDKAAVNHSQRPNLAYRILLRPLITEKATNLTGANKYSFLVAKGANKLAVGQAIEALYGVKPRQVNLLNVRGKVVTRGRVSGKRRDWRKAIVTLPKGTTIQIYEGV